MDKINIDKLNTDLKLILENIQKKIVEIDARLSDLELVLHSDTWQGSDDDDHDTDNYQCYDDTSTKFGKKWEK
ncbi:MAG TPA: hypothetical protein VMR41_06355 [Patescibacteria group bacterium]|nr:hypothetical protein [Patescibacteria group bacterium]